MDGCAVVREDTGYMKESSRKGRREARTQRLGEWLFSRTHPRTQDAPAHTRRSQVCTQNLCGA